MYTDRNHHKNALGHHDPQRLREQLAAAATRDDDGVTLRRTLILLLAEDCPPDTILRVLEDTAGGMEAPYQAPLRAAIDEIRAGMA
jgi:hypothetical protein